MPDAKDLADAEQKLLERARPYADFESDYARNGAAAFVNAAHRLGHSNIIDAANPAHAAHVAAAFHGFSLAELAERAGFVPIEQVEQLLAQHDPSAAGTGAILDEWSRGRPGVDRATRLEMADVLADAKFKDRPNESTTELLNRAYERVQRNRQRRGHVAKAPLDQTIEHLGEQAYGGAA